MYQYIYFYTFSVSDLFSVFLRPDERLSMEKINPRFILYKFGHELQEFII